MGPRGVAAYTDLGCTHLGWALFRVGFHSGVFWLLLDLWNWRASAFEQFPTRGAALVASGLLVNALLVLGWKTRPLLFVNAVLLRAIFAHSQDTYTVDEVVEQLSLVLLFAERPRAFALDCWREPQHPHEPVRGPLGPLLILALTLLYWDSLLHKLRTSIWPSGAAFWLATALPFTGTHLLPQWAERAWLMRSATYGTLLYEALFPLLAVKRLRPWVCLAGIGLHIGTGIFLPLPQFAWVMVAAVALFLPGAALATPGSLPRPALPWSRSARLAACVGAAMIVSQAQLMIDPGAPRPWLSRAVAAYPHAIFVEWHFTLPAPLLRLTTQVDGRETLLPSFDRDRPTTRDRYFKMLGFSWRAAGNPPPEIARYARAWFAQRGLEPRPVAVGCRDARLRTLALDFSLDDEVRARPFVPCGMLMFKPGAGK